MLTPALRAGIDSEVVIAVFFGSGMAGEVEQSEAQTAKPVRPRIASLNIPWRPLIRGSPVVGLPGCGARDAGKQREWDVDDATPARIASGPQ